MSQKQSRQSRYLALAIFLPLLLLLTWYEVGREFGWRDALFALGASGLLGTIAIAAGRRQFRATLSRPFERFVRTFVEYFSLFAVVYGTPFVDSYLWHPLMKQRQTVLEILGHSIGMGLGFAFFSLMRDTPSTIENTAPSIMKLVSVYPVMIEAGESNVTLTMNGLGFSRDMQVLVNGSERQFQFVNNGQIMLLIPANDIAVPGMVSVVLQLKNSAVSTTLQVS